MQPAMAGWGSGLLGVLIFSGSLPATRVAVGGFSPLFLTSARAAIAALDEAERVAQNKARVLTIRGRLKYEIGEPFNSIDDFDAAIKLDDKTPRAQYFRGLAKMMVWDYESAAANFTSAIEQDPALLDCRLQRAKSLALSGKLTDALVDIEAYVLAAPASSDGQLEAASIYQALDKKDLYETALARAIKTKGPLDEAIDIERRVEYLSTLYKRIAIGDIVIPQRKRAEPK